MNVETLLAELPPNVRYERRELPDEENALGPWLAAGAAIVEREPTDRLCGEFLDCLKWSHALPNHAPAPTDAQRTEVDELLARNEPAQELLDEGLARGRVQLPPQQLPLGGLMEDPVAGTWRSLSRMRHTRAVLSLADHKFEQAARDAVAWHRMGAMLCAGEVMTWQYIVATGMRKSALDLMEKIVSAPGARATIRQLFVREIDEALQREDGYAMTQRIEASCYAVPMIASLPDGQDVGALVDEFHRQFYDSTPINNLTEDDPDRVPEKILNARLELRRRQLRRLFEGHPQIFDPLATVRRVGEQFEDVLLRMNEGPPRPDGRVRRALDYLRYWTGWDRHHGIKRGWPESLLPNYLIDYFGADPLAQRERDQLYAQGDIPRWYVRSLSPVSDDQLDRYAARMREIPNPVGEVVASSLESDYARLAWEYRAKLESTWSELNSKTAA
jgi:hypothetical protein